MAILVATNLTANDHAARELAGALAKRMGDGVVLAHVLENAEAPTAATVADLDRTAAEVARFGVEIERIVLHGAPTSALMDYAKLLRPRLVIIGTAHVGNGKKQGFAKARHLLSRLDIPVLYASKVVPFMSALIGGHRPHVLAVLGDGTPTNVAILETVRTLRRSMPIDCTFFYGCGHDLANGTLRARATSGAFDLMIVGAKNHVSLIDDDNDELCPIIFVAPKKRNILATPPREVVAQPSAASAD